jgi:hypothetical protein
VYTIGLVMLFYLVRPLLRATLTVDLRRSWMVDVPLLLGGVWAVAGVQVVSNLGGCWTVWLAGWWLWCAAGGVLHARRLSSGWAQAAALAVQALGLPVAIGVLPFSTLASPAHELMEDWWRRGTEAAAIQMGWAVDAVLV